MDYKITDIVDQQALDEVNKLKGELVLLKEEYVKVTQSLAVKINVDVKSLQDFKTELNSVNEMLVKLSGTEVKISETQKKYSESVEKVVQQMEKRVEVQQKSQQVAAQTTNTISRELAEIEKENAKKREEFNLDKKALEITNQILGSRKANLQSLAEYQQTLASLKQEKKEIDQLEKDGIITSEEALMRRTDLLEAERATKASMQETQTVLKNQEKLAQDAAGSYTELSHQLELMKKAYKQLNDEEKAGESGQILGKEIQNLDAHLKDLAADMGEFQRNVGNYAIASGSLKSEVSNLSNQFAELLVQYRALSDEEKKGEMGQALARQMEDVRTKAGDLKDALSDARASIQQTASDSAGWDSIAGQLGLVAGGFAAATAAGKLFGAEEEELTQIQAGVVAVIGFANEAREIQNGLQKQSAVMIGITTVQHAAETKAIQLKTAAEGKGIIATKAATLAQKAFNLVAKANPYVLLATAVVSVVGALAAFALGAKKAKDEVAEANRELREMDNLMLKLKDDSNFEIELARAAGATTEELRKMREEAAKAQLAMARLNQTKVFDMFIRDKASEEEWKKAQEAVIEAQNNLQEVQRRNRVEVVAEETQANKDRLKAQQDAAKARLDAQKKAQEEARKAAEEHAKYMEDIDKQLAQSGIDLLSGKDKDIATIKAKYQERYDAIKGSTDKEIELRENLSKIEQKEIEEVEAKYLEESVKDQQEASEKKIKAIEDEVKRKSDILNGSLAKDLLEQKKAFNEGKINEEQYQEEVNRLREKYANNVARDTRDYLQSVLNTEVLTEEEREKIYSQWVEASSQFEDLRVQKTIEANEKIKESNKKALESAMEIVDAAAQVVDSFAGFGDQLFQNQIDKIDKELDEITKQYDDAVAHIEDLEKNGSISAEEAEARKRAARDKTMQDEERLAKRREEIEKKQARLAKANAIAQAIISTALAVVKALPNVVLAALAGAMGAAQLATIIATPVNAYKMGTKDHPGGKAIVGDGGRPEVVFHNGKAWLTPATPTLIDLPKHAQVFPDVLSFEKMKPMLASQYLEIGKDIEVINDYGALQNSIENGNNKVLKMLGNLYKQNERNSFDRYLDTLK